jgi:hypothetical protein
VERWDSAAGRAEIWVAMDTVYGNRDTQTLRMYWGNLHALAKSSGPAVFDTARGFQAVWHLGEDRAGVGQAGVYHDATGHGYHGLDSVSAPGKEGVAGRGQEFDGVADYIRIPAHVSSLSNRSYSLSLWLKIAGPGGSLFGQYSPDGDWSPGESSFYLGDGTWIPNGKGGGQCRDSVVAPGRCVNGRFPSSVGFSRGYAVTNQEVGTDAWHHLAITWDGASKSGFFLDGTLMGMGLNNIITGPDSASFDLYIGRPNGLESIAYFKGSLDEVRLSTGVQDKDWIRLSYESQRSDSKLIELILP